MSFRDIDPDKIGFATKAMRGGKWYDELSGALNVPIYTSNSYRFDSVQDGADRCFDARNGHCYSRISNPTWDLFERTFAILEGGESACVFASGVGAIAAYVLTMVQQGDHVICDNCTYSATAYIFNTMLPKFGVESDIVDFCDVEAVKKAIRPNTKLIHFETPCNPTMKFVDIEAIAKLGKEHNILTSIDATFMTPYLCKPLELGIDVVLHAATKYIGGHGDAMGGVIVGPDEIVSKVREDGLKNIGACASPYNAYIFMRGLKTLGMRVQRHSDNAMKIAEFLEQHPMVENVYYPGLKSHPQHEIAARQMQNGFGGNLAFEVKGGVEGGITVMENLDVLTLAVSLGDTDTLVQHPASMTHWYVPKEQREAAGITDGLIRLSVGLEEPEDLIADLDKALNKIKL